MKKAVFKKPFSDYSANKGFLSNLLNKEGYDKEKINHHLSMIKKGFKGESNLNYYLENTFKEIYCLHNVRIKNGKQKSQIDFVVIARDCIWVLESKSLSGHTTVCEDGKIIRNNGECIKYPVIQAEIQANNLKEFLINKNLITEDIEVKHKIVFTDNSKNATITYKSDDIKKYFIEVELISTIFDDEVEEKLSLLDIDKISNSLIRETKSVGETIIKDSDYLLKDNNNNNNNNDNYYKNKNKNNYSKLKHKQEIKNNKQANYKKKKSNTKSTLFITIFLFFIWFNYVSPLVDQTMSVLDTPSEQLFNNIEEEQTTNDKTETVDKVLTSEQIALGEQRYIVKVLPKPIASSTPMEQTSEIMLIADNMTKDELVSILKTNYSDKYDYAKVTITTSKDLFDYYNVITFSTPDNLEEVESKHLIGHYFKNTASKNLSDYGKDRIKFVQKSGSFANLYNQYIDVK